MTPALAITDHALLRWMERVHEIDVDTWRRLCREEADGALAAFDGTEASNGPAFIMSTTGGLLTFLGEGQRVPRTAPGSVAIPALDRIR